MNTRIKSYFIAFAFSFSFSLVYSSDAKTFFWSEASLTAQQEDEAYGIFENQDQYYHFMRDVKAEGASNPELMAMVPLINDIVLNQPIGSTGQKYNATNSTLGLLANEDIRKDLEMVDDQYEDLQKANEEIQRRAAEQLKALDLTDIKSATEQILAIRDQSEKELRDTLLPHQMKRLLQLAAKNQLRYRSLVQILTSDPMKTELEINDKQSRDLKNAEKEIEAELEREIAKLREKAREKLLSNLRSAQRDQINEIFGDFEFGSEATSQRPDRKKRWKK